MVRVCPLNVAETFAAEVAVIVPAVAVNDALVWPTGITTLSGTERLELLLDSETWTPPTGAGALSVNVHDVFPGAVIEVTAQLTVLKEGNTVTAIVPGELIAGIEPAAADDAITFVRLMGMVPVTLGAS